MRPRAAVLRGIAIAVQGPLITGSVYGNRLPFTPRAVANLTLDYTYSMFGGQADANATYVYGTGFYTEPTIQFISPDSAN